MTVLILVGNEGKKTTKYLKKFSSFMTSLGSKQELQITAKEFTLLSDWKIQLYNLDKVTYFPRRKIPRVYLIQTLPSLDLPGDSQFSPLGTRCYTEYNFKLGINGDMITSFLFLSTSFGCFSTNFWTPWLCDSFF